MSEQPRILFCCFDVVPGPSAVSRRLTEYLKGIGQRFQVVVLSLKTADNSHIQRYHGARLLRVPVGTGDLPAQAQAFDRAVRRQLESEEYVLAHVFDPFGGAPIVERAPELGYSVVYEACTLPSLDLAAAEPPLAPEFVSTVRGHEQACLAAASRVIVGSDLARKAVVARGAAAAKVKVLRAPIDRAPFTAQAMGKPDTVPMTLMHLGAVHPWTGMDRVIDAMAQLRTSVELRLKIVGEVAPSMLEQLKARIEAHGLADRVELQAPVAHDDIYKVLAAADVGLLSLSDGERNRLLGGPLARLGEYLAAGRPVLAADLPIARELSPPGATAFYDPASTASLAEVISNLAENPARRVTLGQAARMAASVWDAGDTTRALLGHLVDLIGDEGSNEVLEVDSNDITQSGQALDDREPTQAGGAPFQGGAVSSDSGSNKARTDPAAQRSSDSSTDANAMAGPPPIMGVLLRDEGPATASVAARASVPPPLPLRSSPSGLTTAPPLPTRPTPDHVIPPLSPTGATPTGAIPVLVPSGSTPTAAIPALSSPSGLTPAIPPLTAPALSTPSGPTPAIPPLTASSGLPRASSLPPPLPPSGTPGPPVLLPASSVISPPVLLPSAKATSPTPAAEPEALEEADVHAVAGTEVAPPTSALDPWLAQLVHGYCPPEAHAFARHVPPTTMPGKA